MVIAKDRYEFWKETPPLPGMETVAKQVGEKWEKAINRKHYMAKKAGDRNDRVPAK